jgi:Arc/MetJ family transcription regulator
MPQWFTSVELDESLLAKAMRLSQAKTKKALFDLLLRTYVRLHEQAEVTKLRGKLVWKSVDELKE